MHSTKYQGVTLPIVALCQSLVDVAGAEEEAI